MDNILIKLTTEEKQRLKELAKAYGMSMSGYMRFMALHNPQTVNNKQKEINKNVEL